MANVVILPKLGQQTEESSIIKWHKKVGDTVRKGDVLFEMETDKAVLEAESFFDGVLLKILVPEGVTVPVNTPVGFIGAAGEKVPDQIPATIPVAASPAPAAAPAAPAPAPKPAPAEPVVAVAQPAPVPAPAPAAPVAPAPIASAAPRRLAISPRARARARDCAIEPAAIKGSGPNGRIVTRDVETYLAARGYDQLRITPAAKQLAIQERVDILGVRGSGEAGRIVEDDIRRAIAERPRPMSRMRQVIAQRLTQSKTTIPHFYVTVGVDMTDLLAYRKTLKAAGQDYTVTDFILAAVVFALKDCPDLNSATDGRTTRWNGAVHLGMAVGLENGLVVPVIRDADRLSLRELHAEAARLAGRARDGKLTPDQMTGGTFTISNMGMLGVENFAAIINPGEAAILAVASTLDTPVAREGRVVVRSVMKITVSADHRIVDGMQAARFVNAIKSRLEDVGLWKSLT